MAVITSFNVTTGSFPNTINVSWTLDQALAADEEVVIRRAELLYPQTTEGVEVFRTDNTNITTFEDTDGLEDNLYYYYAGYIFNTTSSTFTTEQSPSTRDRAISYRNWGEGDRLFRQLPTEIQDHDSFFGDHLRKLFDVIGNQADYFRTRCHSVSYGRRLDLIDEKLLEFILEMFGFQIERGLDIGISRGLAQGIIDVYKKKGTCQALVDFVKLFTGWDSRCDDELDLTFRTWDPNTKRNLGFLTGSVPNQAIDANAAFSTNIWTNGKFVDPEDDPFYNVLGNDATTITFKTKTSPFQRLDGTGGIGLTATTFQDTTQSWTNGQWRGHRLYIDSFSTTEYWVIIDNDADTLTLNPLYTNYGTPSTYQQVPLDIVAASVVNFRIEPEYYVQQGRHSLLYDNTVPPGFRGLTKDPAHFLVGGNRSLLTLGQFSDFAVALIIEGVSPFVGRSTNLTSTVLTDDNADFGPVDGLVGQRLNPNLLQASDFEIVANDTTTITVVGDMTELAAIGNNYYVIDETDSIKSKRLREVLPEFAPFYTDLFIFFEPIS